MRACGGFCSLRRRYDVGYWTTRNPEWERTRLQVIRRAKGKCETCGKKGEHVHHLVYWPRVNGKRRRGGEPLEWLRFLCRDCHGAVHDVVFRPFKIRTDAQREKKRRNRARRKAEKQGKPRTYLCDWCGGTYSRRKHNAICVKHGVTSRK